MRRTEIRKHRKSICNSALLVSIQSWVFYDEKKIFRQKVNATEMLVMRTAEDRHYKRQTNLMIWEKKEHPPKNAELSDIMRMRVFLHLPMFEDIKHSAKVLSCVTLYPCNMHVHGKNKLRWRSKISAQVLCCVLPHHHSFSSVLRGQKLRQRTRPSLKAWPAVSRVNFFPPNFSVCCVCVKQLQSERYEHFFKRRTFHDAFCFPHELKS